MSIDRTAPRPDSRLPPEAEIYTLRVWRLGTQFRAVLRAVGDERLHLFDEPQRVAEFLSAGGPAEPPRE